MSCLIVWIGVRWYHAFILASPSLMFRSSSYIGTCATRSWKFLSVYYASSLDKQCRTRPPHVLTVSHVWLLSSRVETWIARTACDSRKMRKTCSEPLSGSLSSLSPKLCENCVRTIFAQFLRKKKGPRAQLFWGPWASGWECPAHNFYTIFSARCNFLKICGCTGQRCLNSRIPPSGIMFHLGCWDRITLSKVLSAKEPCDNMLMRSWNTVGDHQPYTTTTQSLQSKRGVLSGWCTNCQNLREAQNIHHPQFCTGDVHHSGIKKRGFLEGGFCKMHASLGRAALSAKCIAGPNILGYLLMFSWWRRSTPQKPSLLNPPFLGSWIMAFVGVVRGWIGSILGQRSVDLSWQQSHRQSRRRFWPCHYLAALAVGCNLRHVRA